MENSSSALGRLDEEGPNLLNDGPHPIGLPSITPATKRETHEAILKPSDFHRVDSAASGLSASQASKFELPEIAALKLPSRSARESAREDGWVSPPRTLSIEDRIKQKKLMKGGDIMMRLDSDKLDLLKRQFFKHDGLTPLEFVRIVMMYANRYDVKDIDLVQCATDLFAQIDVNNDGSLEWEEFISFIVESGLMTQQSNAAYEIRAYKPSNMKDDTRRKHDKILERMIYFSEIDVILTSERPQTSCKIYSAENGQMLRSWIPHSAFMFDAACLPSHRIITTSADLSVAQWEYPSLKLRHRVYTKEAQICIKFSQVGPDRSRPVLFSGSASGVLVEWEFDHLSHMKEKRTVKAHTDVITAILVIDSLESVATASLDTTIHMWDINTMKSRRVFTQHTKGVLALAYSPEQRYLISAGFDNNIIVWNPFLGTRSVAHLKGHYSPIVGVEAVAGTPQIVTVDMGSNVKIWDIRNFACVQQFKVEEFREVSSFCIASRHKRVCVGYNRMAYFDYDETQFPWLTDDHPSPQILFNRVSSSIMTISGRNVMVWDASTGKLIQSFKDLMDSEITAISLDERERKFFAADYDGVVKVFNYQNGAEMEELDCIAPHQSEVAVLMYCKGTFLISAQWDGHITAHDDSGMHKGVFPRTYEGVEGFGDLSTIAYSERADLLAAGSVNGLVIMWDLENGSKEAVLGADLPGTREITAIQFLDPHPVLVVADNNGGLFTYCVRPHKLRNTLRSSMLVVDSEGANNPQSPAYVTCLKYDTHEQILFAGDDQGFLRAWKLGTQWFMDMGLHSTKKRKKSSLNRVGMTPGSLHSRRSGLWKMIEEASNHASLVERRNSEISEELSDEGVDLSPTPHLQELTFAKGPNSTFLTFVDAVESAPASECASPAPSRASPTPPRRRLSRVQSMSEKTREVPWPASAVWEGHSDSVLGLELIDQPPALISSGRDCMVKIWSGSGNLLGKLMQGDDWAGEGWEFEPDILGKLRQDFEFAAEMLNVINSGEKMSPAPLVTPKTPTAANVEERLEKEEALKRQVQERRRLNAFGIGENSDRSTLDNNNRRVLDSLKGGESHGKHGVRSYSRLKKSNRWYSNEDDFGRERRKPMSGQQLSAAARLSQAMGDDYFMKGLKAGAQADFE